MSEKELDFSVPASCASYLKARDPSILSWNRLVMTQIRHNLADEFSSQSEATATIPSVTSSGKEEDERLSVHLRIKGGVPPNSIYSIEGNTLVCRVPEGSFAARNNRLKTRILKKYTFTNIFDAQTTQEKLFHQIVKPKILSFINGNNSTLLAYGVSGSGKTFTMVGTAEQPGVIPRSLDYLFRTLSEKTTVGPLVKPLPNGKIQLLSDHQMSLEIDNLRNILNDPQSFTERTNHVKTYNEMQRRLSSNTVGMVKTFPPLVAVWVSFAEIYNENIFDLLQPLPVRGQQRAILRIGGLHDETYIRGLKYIYVRSGLEAYQVLQYGLHNLSYAATGLNQQSSRSHCIFSVRLVAGNDERHCNLSVFNFCDLAGSERLKNTMNKGDRLKESTKINTSLSVLGRCISNIRDMQQNMRDSCNAPFRDSKLTQLFQKALQGKEDILMIVNINPSSDMFDDTQHALIFSAIAKQIVAQDIPRKILKPNRFSAYRHNFSLDLEENDESKWEESKEEELSELRDERAHLVLQLSELRLHIDDIIEAERTYLRTNYDILVGCKDKQIAFLEDEINKLGRKKVELERELRKTQLQIERQEIIVLNSSEEDSDAEEKANNNQRPSLEMELQKHQQEIDEMRIQHETIQKNLRNEYSHLQAVLDDARKDFEIISDELKETRRQVEELKGENLSLEDAKDILNRELEAVRQQLREQNEEIDMLKEMFAGTEIKLITNGDTFDLVE